MSLECVIGLFVGGQSSRMGGFPKGNLQAPGSALTLLERLIEEARAASAATPLVLVGNAEPYASLSLPALADQPPGIGPIGGLGALLEQARSAGKTHVVALACDLPRLDRTLIARLLEQEPQAAALVAQQGVIRNPLIARYEVERARAALTQTLAEDRRSLQAVLDQLGPSVACLELSAVEKALLDDWDTPADAAGEISR